MLAVFAAHLQGVATLDARVGVLELKSIEDIMRWPKNAVADAGEACNTDVRQANIVGHAKVDAHVFWFSQWEKLSRIVRPAEPEPKVVNVSRRDYSRVTECQVLVLVLLVLRKTGKLRGNIPELKRSGINQVVINISAEESALSRCRVIDSHYD